MSAAAEGEARKPVVLFLCIHNAGRSVAARVLLDHYAAGRVEVLSAGSEPGRAVNPAVAGVLAERGLTASREFPKPLTGEMARAADVVVTTGCGDTCPVYPGKRYLDWPVADPAGLEVDVVVRSWTTSTAAFEHSSTNCFARRTEQQPAAAGVLALGLSFQNQGSFSQNHVQSELSVQRIIFTPVAKLRPAQKTVPCLVANAESP